MRCLYCGKELALLKRWTGGGEFCSDAHRQQYQDEYNQLALNRLLQAKPPIPSAESRAEAVLPNAAPAPASRSRAARAEKQPLAPPPPVPAAAKSAPRKEEPRPPIPERIAEPEPVAEPAPVVIARQPEPEPEVEQEPEELAPAELADFFIELPVPALVEMAMARPDAVFESNGTPALPQRNFEAWETQLVAAGPLESTPFTRILDCAAPPRDRKLDAREFVRTAPLVEVDLDAAGENELPEMIEDPMDILIFPHPPQAAPPLWEEPWQEFAIDKNLGALARVAFRTTGVEDNEDASDPVETLVDFSPEPAPRTPAPPVSAEPAKPAPFVAAKAAVAVPEPEIAKPVAKPAPPQPPAAPTPVVSRPTFLRPPYGPPPEKIAPSPKAPVAVNQKTIDTPPPATKPLPVTLHGLAAGRGKPVQVFAAVSAGVDLQIPRSNALPLRPVMTLGQALGVAVEEKKLPERTVVVKVDPRKSTPARPDSRSANGKGRRDQRGSQAVENEPEKKESEQKAAAGPAKAPPIKPADKPAEKAPEKLRESALPAPLAAPYNPPDLGLPSLDLEASGGFWKRLPLSGKAGLGLTMVALFIAIVFIMKSGTSAAAGPRVVEAPAFTANEGGWITDWGVEPGVRTLRDISVLRPTLNMSDYRIEFEAQIDSKALGWIYRAQDVKNYYVSKLEIVKPGINPTVSVVRYAVIGGEELPHAQFPLNMAVRIDTMYKIRFDAVGDHFTTWVQDQKVDDWTDARLKTGGVGMYSDRGESRTLKNGSLRVAPLVIKK
jgi:hypothetical protein